MEMLLLFSLLLFIRTSKSTDVQRPAMKAINTYWYDAAKYIEETAGTTHVREGIITSNITSTKNTVFNKLISFV